MKQYAKLAKYLRGTGDALKRLADEIDDDCGFSKESEELMSKIGGELLFHAKSYSYLASHN